MILHTSDLSFCDFFRPINKETQNWKPGSLFGDFPIMTEMGTFIINGGERIVFSWCAHPVFTNDKVDKNGKVGHDHSYPNRGMRLSLKQISKDIAYTSYRLRHAPTTNAALDSQVGDDEIAVDIFGDMASVRNTIEKDIHKNSSRFTTDEVPKKYETFVQWNQNWKSDGARRSLLKPAFYPLPSDWPPLVAQSQQKPNIKTRLLGQTIVENW